MDTPNITKLVFLTHFITAGAESKERENRRTPTLRIMYACSAESEANICVNSGAEAIGILRVFQPKFLIIPLLPWLLVTALCFRDAFKASLETRLPR